MAKRADVSFTMSDDVNQNEFKNWIKNCPFSPDGGQNLRWTNLEPDPAAEPEKAKKKGGKE